MGSSLKQQEGCQFVSLLTLPSSASAEHLFLTHREAGGTGLIFSTQQQRHAHVQGPLLRRGRGGGSWCSHPIPVLFPSCFRGEYPNHPEKDVELRKISVLLLGLGTSSHSANAWWVGVQAAVQQRTRLGACPRGAHSQANQTPKGRRLLGHLAPELFRVLQNWP